MFLLCCAHYPAYKARVAGALPVKSNHTIDIRRLTLMLRIDTSSPRPISGMLYGRRCYMSVESVRAFFAENGLDYEIRELDASTETVEKAAEALGVKPALIAKTLAFKLKDRDILVVTKGDAKTDNRKLKLPATSCGKSPIVKENVCLLFAR